MTLDQITEKIIIYNICHAGGVYHYRDVYLLSLCISVNIYVNTGLILLFLYLYMLTVPVAESSSVMPEIKCPLLTEA